MARRNALFRPEIHPFRMSDWKIRRRHGECSRCQSVFEDGTRHASILRIDDEELLVREDLCPECWEGEDAAEMLFWWFTRHQEDKRKTLRLDLESLERLFMELEGREQEKIRELRYLVCLLLMRKRKLKLIRVERKKQGEKLILRRPRRTEELSVWVVDFTPERMEEMRASLQEALEGAGAADPEERVEDEPTVEAGSSAPEAPPVETEDPREAEGAPASS